MTEPRTETTTTERADDDGAASARSGNGGAAGNGAPGNGMPAPGAVRPPAIGRPATDCTVVIPVHNKASLTRQCLNTLLAQRRERVEREIVVVNDGSIDLTGQLLTAYAGQIRVVAHSAAAGFARACNVGAAGAAGRYLVFLNNDTLPRPGWLRSLVAYADAHPAAAVVGAKLLYPNDTVQHAGVVFGLDRYPHHLYAGFPADHPATDVSRRFRAVTAACCLIRREAFETASGFDTGFVNGWEDVDLCLRLGEAGHEVHYCHESVVYHLESASRDLRAPRERENRGLYEERWRDRVVPDDLGYYAADGLLTVAYTARHPIRLGVSPLLAGIDVGDNERLADKLLQERARQVAILLRNNLVMNMRVQEAELKVQAAERRAREAESRVAAGSAGAAAGSKPTSLPSLANAGPATPVQQPIIGSCERPGRQPEVVAEDFLVVSGWALSKAGISRIETYVDGHRRGEITYGDWLRPDVAALYPGYPDDENCGFVGKVPVEGLGDGQHDLMIRVMARDGKKAELRTRFEVDSTAKSTGRVLAAFDRPKPGARAVVRDRLAVAGWTLAPSGIRSIETFVDGERLGSVSHGALRPDVGMAHPDYPEPDHSGFTGSVPVSHLPDGEHALLVRITAEDDRGLELKARFEIDTSEAAVGDVPHVNAQYAAWLSKHAPSEADVARAREAAAALSHRPKISLLAPIEDEAVGAVIDMIEALRGQVYDNWEVCLVPDVMSDGEVLKILGGVSANDPRIVIPDKARTTGWVGTANAALALAGGEFVGLLSLSESLSPLALFEVARLLNEVPEIDVVYGDEDKIDDEVGVRWDPYFKPDWSPDLLLSGNYFGRFALFRRTLVDEIGGFRRGFPGEERYDLALRATERTERVGHVPRLLSSHRLPLSVSAAPGGGETASEAAQKALTDALDRRGIAGAVGPGIVPGHWRVRYALREQPGVTLLMPTGGKLQFLKPCLESILGTSTYPNLEIVLVDNSSGDGVADLCREVTASHPDLRLRREPFGLSPFNFSAIVNHGAPFVETPYLVMLNDDVTVITPDWLEAMLEHAQRPEIGVVGAKLLYPDDTIQHAGVLLGPYQGTGHAFKGFAGDYAGYFGLPNVVRNYSAVTFACAMMRKEVFDEVGGLDADNLPIAFNDVDMCLRIGDRGYRVVYTPHAALYHHESVTKKVIAAPTEIGHLRNRWGHLIDRDPFYNPNLTQRGEDLSLNME